MQFYSDLTRKLYPTQEECEAQEAEYREKEEAKKRAQRELEEAQEARKQELDALVHEINEATADFNKKLSAYLCDYGRYAYKSESDNTERVERLSPFASFLHLCGW